MESSPCLDWRLCHIKYLKWRCRSKIRKMMDPEPLWSVVYELTLSFLLGTFIFFIGLIKQRRNTTKSSNNICILENMTACSKNQTSSCYPVFLKLMSRFQIQAPQNSMNGQLVVKGTLYPSKMWFPLFYFYIFLE